MDWLDQITGYFARVPPGVWVAAMIINLIVTATTWSTARRRLRRASEHIASAEARAGGSRRDTALTVAALIPASLFLVMVLAGSMHGLVAFGANVLGWQDGWEYLVPATLDGVSVAFAFLAFRAVRRGKAPDRCYRVVWGAAGASAAINYSYEYGSSSNVLAGGYVALLSVLGMVMFHELLAQFEDGIGSHIRRENPKFGMRWLTWPTNTLAAAVAWRNHPPPEDTPGTVSAAIENLDRVRQAKRAQRLRSAAVVPGRRARGHEVMPSPRPAQTRAGLAEPTTGRRREAPASESGWEAPAVRVPATAATLLDWAVTWTRVVVDGDFLTGLLTNDVLARERYGRSARQLRRLRQAVVSGALRRQAAQLGVDLPADFIDLSTDDVRHEE